MIVIVNKYLVPKGYVGMAIFPFVLLSDRTLKEDAVLMNHERIHLRQQIELLIVFFFIWYFLEFLIRVIIRGGLKKAYRNISFEREAYFYEKNPDYIKTKKIFSFIKFL